MSTMLAPIYDNQSDIVMLGQTPTLMQPLFGELPPPPTNEHRFIVGRNGVYIEVRTEVMECRLKVADNHIPFPYGEVTDGFRLIHGEIPVSLYDEVRQKAKNACPNEWAGLIVWSAKRQSYELFEPHVIECSPSSISYSRALPDDLELVVDIHSHGAAGSAYFSKTDDISEDGIYIAEVIGHCAGEPTWASRFVINGLLVNK